MYLPLNGAIANVVRYDLYPHFQGNEFLNVNISKTLRASKNAQDDFYKD